MTTILERYLKTLEDNFYAAVMRAKVLGEISESADAREHAKVLVGYSTGVLSLAKVLSERQMRTSVKATIAALK